ncbi:hypothetical protein HDV00_004357 [Rhizophlyctis rosea]|nr:hypothetical protein HDV00_004357 [Rhizophlyctis rosea]
MKASCTSTEMDLRKHINASPPSKFTLLLKHLISQSHYTWPGERTDLDIELVVQEVEDTDEEMRDFVVSDGEDVEGGDEEGSDWSGSEAGSDFDVSEMETTPTRALKAASSDVEDGSAASEAEGVSVKGKGKRRLRRTKTIPISDDSSDEDEIGSSSVKRKVMRVDEEDD